MFGLGFQLVSCKPGHGTPLNRHAWGARLDNPEMLRRRDPGGRSAGSGAGAGAAVAIEVKGGKYEGAELHIDS